MGTPVGHDGQTRFPAQVHPAPAPPQPAPAAGTAPPPPDLVISLLLALSGMIGSAAIGLTLGAATERAQAYLPWTAASLANSSGSWVLVAFLVALTGRNLIEAGARGTITLVGLVVGFYEIQAFRGIAVDPHTVLFWTAAALVVGPLVGAAAGAVRKGRPVPAALGAGVIGGLLIGEALYGLHYIAASTSTEYWHIQLAAGVLVAAGLAWWRSRHLLAVVPSGLACVATAGLTLGAYVRV